jgi:hypothetical protein
MRKPVAITLLILATGSLLILAAGSFWAWCSQPGLTSSERLLVSRQDPRPFTREAWRTADAKARGGMLRDLLQQNDFRDARNDDVFRLLGPSTCYADYEDEPCYVVELSGTERSFVFGVNHSHCPGRIVSLSLGSP